MLSTGEAHRCRLSLEVGEGEERVRKEQSVREEGDEEEETAASEKTVKRWRVG